MSSVYANTHTHTHIHIHSGEIKACESLRTVHERTADALHGGGRQPARLQRLNRTLREEKKKKKPPGTSVHESSQKPEETNVFNKCNLTV